ncbi:MAG: hypothetical protein QM741_06485 [Rudaea sp.]|uniref:hypothetical protein n=1 Tax=Rudaea sp. TaxID=2136325 RepID=UPI0039E5144F
MRTLDAMEISQKGKGNWAIFNVPLETVHAAAAEWEQALAGVSRPWLCWNVSDRWCMLQQRLVQEVGWTPVVGFDPRSGPPTVLPGSILIDFNAHFGFEVMFPLFPMEFAFLFAERLGFWHSDLLCRLDVMHKLAEIFESLPDGSACAVHDLGGRRNLLNFRKHRYWELVGCTTKSASRSQFEHGAGWWRYFDHHPNCPDEKERRRRARYYYDHGVGVMYWKRKYGGKMVGISEKWVAEGHCTSINNKSYKPVNLSGVTLKGAEIDINFNIEEVAKHLGIGHLLT